MNPYRPQSPASKQRPTGKNGDTEKAAALRPFLPERRNLLNEFEAAEYLGMSVGWLRKSRMLGWREGKTTPPPYIRLGRAIKYDPADLDAWIASNKVHG